MPPITLPSLSPWAFNSSSQWTIPSVTPLEPSLPLDPTWLYALIGLRIVTIVVLLLVVFPIILYCIGFTAMGVVKGESSSLGTSAGGADR